MGESVFPFLLQAVPVVLVLLAMTIALIRHQNARQQQAQGVLWLQALRTLITHIQRHRGLSAGVLAGDLSLQSKLADTQLQVSRDFVQISGVGEWIKHNPSWQGITQHWARLAGNVLMLSVPRCLDQHNRLIKNILVLIDEIALVHYLQNASNSKSNIWRDLLTLAEYIGQARAIGTALAAQNHDLDNIDCHKARRELRQLDREIVTILDTPECRGALDSDSIQDIVDFLSYIQANILQDGPLVLAGEFFRVATHTLDHLYEEFDQELAQVHRRLAP